MLSSLKHVKRVSTAFLSDPRPFFHVYSLSFVALDLFQIDANRQSTTTSPLVPVSLTILADDDKCQTAYEYCNIEETTPYYASGLNPYDIRKECGDSSLCYNMTSTETFLNLESTKTALGVSKEVKEWVECNNKVNGMFANDWMHNFGTSYPPVIATLKGMSYSPSDSMILLNSNSCLFCLSALLCYHHHFDCITSNI